MSKEKGSRLMISLSLIAIILSVSSLAYVVFTVNDLREDLSETADLVDTIGKEIGIERLVKARQEGKVVYSN